MCRILIFPIFAAHEKTKSLTDTNMGNIKAVIFDMDGVIVDTEPLHIEAYHIFFKKLNIPGDDELFHSFVGVSIEENIREIVESVLKEDISQAEKRIKQRNDIYVDLLKTRPLEAIDGFNELMDHLHRDNIVTALASSSPWQQIDIITDKLGIRDKFTVMCSGHDVPATKPAPDIYLKTVNELNLDSSEVIAIEDSVTGLSAAKAAGLSCIALKNPYMDDHKLEELADFTVRSLHEARSLI